MTFKIRDKSNLFMKNYFKKNVLSAKQVFDVLKDEKQRSQFESRSGSACALRMSVMRKWLLSKKTKTGVSYSTAAGVWRWSICTADAKGNQQSFSVTDIFWSSSFWRRWISLLRAHFLQESLRSTGL